MPRESNATLRPISFQKARREHAGLIADLVNSAYRGDSSRVGWTTEADLLEGKRTNEREVLGLIEAAGSMILLCLQGDDIMGSVHLEKRDAACYLGLFVVRPERQNTGIGKRFIQAAEDCAQQEWGITKMTMTVISLRRELIAFYERRGYRRTGEMRPFPTDAGLSVAKVQGLQFEVLEKCFDQPKASE